MIDPNLLAQSGKKVDPNYQIDFPKDHYEHPEYDIEWWYLTSNLTDSAGKKYTLQFTMFRFRTGQAPNGWDNGQTYMAHASIHAGDRHWFSERFAKGGIGHTSVSSAPFNIKMDEWQWSTKATVEDDLFPATLVFNAHPTSSKETQTAQVNLQLTSNANYVLQGDKGYSIKSGDANHASYYYSQPFIEVHGELQLDGESIAVSGQAWFDHEWTSQLIDQQSAGWDWFSIHLDNGDKLMAFVMRLNGKPDYQTGTYIYANGTSKPLSKQQISLTKLNSETIDSKIGVQKIFPSEWEISIPELDVKLKTKVSKRDQFNPSRFSYYEGSINVSGTHSGIGFMELTGY